MRHLVVRNKMLQICFSSCWWFVDQTLKGLIDFGLDHALDLVFLGLPGFHFHLLQHDTGLGTAFRLRLFGFHDRYPGLHNARYGGAEEQSAHGQEQKTFVSGFQLECPRPAGNRMAENVGEGDSQAARPGSHTSMVSVTILLSLRRSRALPDERPWLADQHRRDAAQGHGPRSLMVHAAERL